MEAISKSASASRACAVFLVVVFSIMSFPASGQEVELKGKYGDWSLYCLKDVDGSNYEKCSLTNGALAPDDPKLWTKVAITLVGPSGEVEMTIRTPLLKYFRNGISLGFDGRQAVRAPIDTCSISSCESIISLNETLMDQVATRRQLSIEYQIQEARGIVIFLDLAQMRDALKALEKGTGLSSEVVASADRRRQMHDAKVLLERRVFELAANAGTSDWKAPLKTCRELPATKVVFVSQDLTIRQRDEVRDWAKKSKECDNSAVWVRQHSADSDRASGLDRAPLWSVYGVVSEVAPAGLVPTEGDDAKVAVAPLSSTEVPYHRPKSSR
ncbi:invasion associated locus B family protein [Bradyrhizobium sp. HKCCYLS2058]|uniref:invasion associated locus B family protein n=1 Tax=Bradyrhizobium TaxID=374 RepID=UPI003EB9DCDB